MTDNFASDLQPLYHAAAHSTLKKVANAVYRNDEQSEIRFILDDEPAPVITEGELDRYRVWKEARIEKSRRKDKSPVTNWCLIYCLSVLLLLGMVAFLSSIVYDMADPNMTCDVVGSGTTGADHLFNQSNTMYQPYVDLAVGCLGSHEVIRAFSVIPMSMPSSDDVGMARVFAYTKPTARVRPATRVRDWVSQSFIFDDTRWIQNDIQLFTVLIYAGATIALLICLIMIQIRAWTWYDRHIQKHIMDLQEVTDLLTGYMRMHDAAMDDKKSQ